MAHFAAGDWNNPSGLVRGQSGAVSPVGVDTSIASPFTNSASPATLVTFTVPRTGLYRISAYLKTTATGTGAGQVAKIQETHNDGTAQAASDVTATGVDGLTLNAFQQSSKVVEAVSGTNIVLTVIGSGTITTPATIQSYWTIEAI